MVCKFSKKRNRDEGAVTRKANIEEIQKRERGSFQYVFIFWISNEYLLRTKKSLMFMMMNTEGKN